MSTAKARFVGWFLALPAPIFAGGRDHSTHEAIKGQGQSPEEPSALHRGPVDGDQRGSVECPRTPWPAVEPAYRLCLQSRNHQRCAQGAIPFDGSSGSGDRAGRGRARPFPRADRDRAAEPDVVAERCLAVAARRTARLAIVTSRSARPVFAPTNARAARLVLTQSIAGTPVAGFPSEKGVSHDP